MARLRYNGLTATLGAALTTSATAVTFGAALTHANGVAVPTIASPDYLPLTILDSSGNFSERVDLTAYTAGATTGTIIRAAEGAGAAVAHSAGDKVVHGPTAADLSGTFSASGTDATQAAASTPVTSGATTTLVSSVTIAPTQDVLLAVTATATANNSSGGQGAYVTPAVQYQLNGDTFQVAGATTDSQAIRSPLSNTPLEGMGMFYLKAGKTYTLAYKLKAGTGGTSVTFTNVQGSYRTTPM